MSGSRARVALVGQRFGRMGGMEAVGAAYIERLSDDFDFVVVSRELDDALVQRVAAWERVRTPARPSSAAFLSFGLCATRRLKQLEVDIVHSTGAIVRPPVDVTTVHYCHRGARAATGRMRPGSKGVRWLNSGLVYAASVALERRTYTSGGAGYVGAVSRGVAQELAAWYPTANVVLTPNGVADVSADTRQVLRKGVREELGLGDDVNVVLFVGGEWGRKGLDVVRRALRIACDTGDLLRTELWVVGGEQHGRVEVGKLTIRYFGWQDPVTRFYAGADVFCLPSQYETFSLVSYEAAICGLPIVGTAVSGITDLVGADDGGGCLVSPNPGAVADALGALLRNPEVRRRKGQIARQRALDFSIERSVESVRGLYEDLLDADSSRG